MGKTYDMPKGIAIEKGVLPVFKSISVVEYTVAKEEDLKDIHPYQTMMLEDVGEEDFGFLDSLKPLSHDYWRKMIEQLGDKRLVEGIILTGRLKDIQDLCADFEQLIDPYPYEYLAARGCIAALDTVVNHDREIFGEKENPTINLLVNIYTKKEWRGQGLAGHLMEEILDEYKSLYFEAKPLTWLDGMLSKILPGNAKYHQDMEQLLGFYKKMGAKKIEGTDDYYVMKKR